MVSIICHQIPSHFQNFIECLSVCFPSLANVNYLHDIWDSSILRELAAVSRQSGVEGGSKAGQSSKLPCKELSSNTLLHIILMRICYCLETIPHLFPHNQLDKLLVDNREQLVIFNNTKRVKYVRVTVTV